MRRSMADRFRARPRSGRIAIAFAALLALALVAALAATVGRVAPADAAGPTPFPPVADSYVQADQAGTNYGAQTQIRADGMPVVRAYLRFNPQGLSGAVTNAVLRVRANSGQPETGYSVQGVASVTWGETSITFSNAPPVSSPAYGPTGAFAAGTWNEVDVTPLVTGNGLVSMA
ncbi:MAG: acid phosphatase type 7, partial [Miltoncostaeaceae bacterium]|nr:acid phosphatase type 7 [Miltoncostaeaceae bacterium]